MVDLKNQSSVEHYKFHHIDTSKCRICKKFFCEKACFRGIYEVLKKDTVPKSTVVRDREDQCVKCHMCTTACKLMAIKID